MAGCNLTVELLRSRLHYDPETGFFTWLVPTHVGRAGARAGTLNCRNKRVYIKFLGINYFAHRLAWFYMTGAWPIEEIDHINRNTSDNSWNNLREANRYENQQNQLRAQRNGSSGFLGVSASDGRWMARIQINKKSIFLGLYPTPELAHEAYMRAKKIHHPFAIF